MDDIKEEEIINELESGKAFIYGTDKQGHPCVIIQIRHYISSESNIQNTIRFAVFILERVT